MDAYTLSTTRTHPQWSRGLTVMCWMVAALPATSPIRGIDPARTDVVTVRAPVQRRPDLAVQRVTAPESTSLGMPVELSALVEELSGDTGAEADCVLKVNGAEVGRAPGIWVDAASAVACAFSHTFSSGGLQVVTVEVAEVVPGDDELSNNEASTSLWVGAPTSRSGESPRAYASSDP